MNKNKLCKNCTYGEIIKYTPEEITAKKLAIPNIGKCDICGTEYIMHSGSQGIMALTLYGTVNRITSTVWSLKLYKRISFSLLERKVIVATNLGSKNIDMIIDIVSPIVDSNNVLKTIVADSKTRTISIVPQKYCRGGWKKLNPLLCFKPLF